MGPAQPGGGFADPFSPPTTAGVNSGPAPESAHSEAGPPRAPPAPWGSPLAEQPPPPPNDGRATGIAPRCFWPHLGGPK